MKHIIAIGSLILISGCSTPPAPHTPSVSVEVDAIELPEQAIDVAHVGMLNGVVMSHGLRMEHLVPAPLDARCGVVSSERPAQDWVADAVTRYTFTGISESWVPINGKPKRYHVYLVR